MTQPGRQSRESLDALLFRRGPLESLEAISFISSVAAALDEVHAQGAAHGDIRPRSIVVDEEGTAKLVFVSATTQSNGDQRYLAPEQFTAPRPTPRADVYALGLVAYEMIAGRPAHAAGHDPVRTRARIVAGVPRLTDEVPGVATVVSEAVARATALDETQRYATAGDFAREFAKAVRSSNPTEFLTRAEQQSGRRTAWPSRAQFVMSLLALFALIGVLNVLGVYGGTRAELPRSSSPASLPLVRTAVPTASPTAAAVLAIDPTRRTPDVAGMSWRDAARLLRERGFRDDVEIFVERNASGPAGTVVRQEPPAGAAFKQGQRVRLFVVGPII